MVRVIDLTKPLDERASVWPGSPAPRFERFATIDDDGAFSRTVSFHEHTGTHIDAPAHFVQGGRTAEDLDVDRLVRPFAVLDVCERCRRDGDHAITVEDIERDIAEWGGIDEGAIVAARTGWEGRLDDRRGVAPLRFPGFSPAAADFLVESIGIEALGIDTPGIDPGCDDAFTVHSTQTLTRDVWHIEGLVNLSEVPPRGSLVVVGALPLAGGSGAPARVVAIVFDKEASVPYRQAYRVVTFVPPDHLDSVLEAVERQSPLIFGPYERSAWWSAAGIEQFRPMADANPTEGRAGELERVPTVRLEFALERDPDLLRRVLDDGLLPTHPWEEPAVFIDECEVSATRMASDETGSL